MSLANCLVINEQWSLEQVAHQIAGNAGVDDQVKFLELLADLEANPDFKHRAILALFKKLALEDGESSARETWQACASELGLQAATQEEIERTRDIYEGPLVAIDDDALTSPPTVHQSAGIWVEAWVWVQAPRPQTETHKAEIPDNELEEIIQAIRDEHKQGEGDVADAIADVISRQGFVVMSSEHYVELTRETHEPAISTEPASLTPDLSECVQELGYSFAAWQTAVGDGDDTESWAALTRIRNGIRTIWNLKPPTWNFKLPNKRQVVEIEIRGGIGEVTKCPDGVEVSIVDWDNLKVGACPFCDVNLPDFARYCPECGERFPSSLLWTR